MVNQNNGNEHTHTHTDMHQEALLISW